MAQKPWIAVLQAARRILQKGGVLTSTALAEETELETKVASAWLFKLEKWGYVSKDQKYITGKRWSWSWALTRWGFRFKVKKGKETLRIAANPPDNQG